MKLKELPLSIYKARRLRNLSLNTLLRPRAEKIPLIVSLTTIAPRLESVDLVIRSLLNQSYSPNKILLWVHESLLKDIPAKLHELQADVFEIRTTPLHVSHKKLIHTIKAFPDTPIVTCDDDLMYRSDFLERLYKESQQCKNTIIANQTRTILKDHNGAFLPYVQWPTNSTDNVNAFNILPIGAEGVLYPPNSLDQRFDQEALFMKLAPKADDLWFKAMSLLKGTPCRLAENKAKKAIPIIGSQKSSLKHINIKQNFNSEQWRQLVTHFKLETLLKMK